MSACKHKYITTYVDSDGEPGGLWGCRDCKARFAPLADQIEAEKQRDLLADALRIIARNVFMYHEETIETIALDALAKVQP